MARNAYMLHIWFSTTKKSVEWALATIPNYDPFCLGIMLGYLWIAMRMI